MEKDAKIMIAGYHGMVGSAICRTLRDQGYDNLICVGRSEVDLVNQRATENFMSEKSPDYVFIAAAKVGGIVANNSYPADFLYDNIMIEANLVHSSYVAGVRKLLFLGSSCIYPKLAAQPLNEDSLLTGPLEPTNEAYAIAKITGIKLCDAYSSQYGRRFISAMPCNLYGYGDNFHPLNSHVIPGMMRRFHEAEVRGDTSVTCWGTGRPKREFMFVDDLAAGLLFIMNHFEGPGFINIGTAEEVTIGELARMIAEVTGFRGDIHWDHSQPDGTPQKILDVGRLHQLGWSHAVSIRVGLERTYDWFVKHLDSFRG